jgi:hypothetical protein
VFIHPPAVNLKLPRAFQSNYGLYWSNTSPPSQNAQLELPHIFSKMAYNEIK